MGGAEHFTRRVLRRAASAPTLLWLLASQDHRGREIGPMARSQSFAQAQGLL
jgi:hypothetical protein